MEGSHGQPEPQQLEGQPNAPPALRLDLLDDTTSLDYDSVDTPREPALGNPLISMAEGLPTSPSRKNKSKSRAAHSLSLSRNASFASRNSLRDSKVRSQPGRARQPARGPASWPSVARCLPAPAACGLACSLSLPSPTASALQEPRVPLPPGLQVLMVTGMKRSESLLQPDLFRYHNHFEFLGVVGRTHLSEVSLGAILEGRPRRLGHRGTNCSLGW